MIITISGLPGSGKTAIGRMLARKLGYKFYSIGELRGEWAIERGMSIDDLNRLGEKELWTDRKADEYQKGLGEEEDNFVIDGRLSFHFIPASFKVFLKVDEKVGAERVHGDERPDEERGTLTELREALKMRIESDDKRYKKLYDLNFHDVKNYDLIIDTTDLKPAAVVDRIIRAVSGKKRG